ncbi:hypothetical protein [Moorena sp. SIO4A5]|uniref:hypothetical protein n=1 Tax=Moorena sp. SIO4A5 TaxID=2607838 RepID=UPI0013CC4090|nr:hypothetical protein [Moorena sp. SIO4A5]NEO24658.1 hypothetical protein [Moorena sp. SIO4A5]
MLVCSRYYAIASELRYIESKSLAKKSMMVILRKNLDLASGGFDTAICVGTFNEKHTPPTCLDELVWIPKDGMIIFDYHNL